MRKIIHALAIPAALIIGIVGTNYYNRLEVAAWKGQAEYWAEMNVKISQLNEKTVGTLGEELNTCADVLDGKLTYQEGTERMLQLHDKMSDLDKEYDELHSELGAE